METYYVDYLYCEIYLKEEDIQAVPESGRADEACFAIADKAYIKKKRYEHHGEREFKVCVDGFVWLLVNHEQARKLLRMEAIPLYRLYEDDSESLIETEEYLEETIRRGYRIGIEMGFVSAIGQAGRISQ